MTLGPGPLARKMAASKSGSGWGARAGRESRGGAQGATRLLGCELLKRQRSIKNLCGRTLLCARLRDGQHYRMEMCPNGKQDKVVPESLRIILRLYLRRPESKSLAPDGGPCTADTEGLLGRSSVVAGEIVPVGKETDRQWEQGEDMSLVDFQILEYRADGKPALADQALKDKMDEFGVRELMRKTGLSQKAIYAILHGRPVRPRTLALLKKALDGGKLIPFSQ